MMEFPVPLLTLLQLQSYLVPFISARIFIILKLQNIHWRQFFDAITLSELFFFSSLNVLLTGILLVPPPFIFTIAISVRTGALRSTFLMLFQLK